jgi:DNA invertase Pin-like site-specific DNA recombinase
MDVEELTGLVVVTADKDPLVGLGAVAQIRAEMERAEAVLVRRARNDGATWVEIAAALGVSKQAVHRKYRGRRVFGDRS